MLITALAEQFFEGYRLREERCSYCKTTLHEGAPVSVYAVRYAGDDEWCVPRLYCWDCYPQSITEPTLGATELLADGRLGCILDGATQRSALALLGIERVTRSEPEEGHVTL